MKVFCHLTATQHQRTLFREGLLINKWAQQYPQVFDEDDLRLANKQGKLGYKFYEWLSAITIHNATGYSVLMEKYEMPKHARKHDIFKSIVPENVFKFIMDPKEKRTQCPDLFCYNESKTDWFLCEVKGKGDRLSKDQRQYFEKIESISGKEILIIKIDK